MSCPDCGGDGTKYVCMCDHHKQLALEHDARLLGVPDIFTSIEDPTLLQQMRERLAGSTTGFILVKVRR